MRHGLEPALLHLFLQMAEAVEAEAEEEEEGADRMVLVERKREEAAGEEEEVVVVQGLRVQYLAQEILTRLK